MKVLPQVLKTCEAKFKNSFVNMGSFYKLNGSAVRMRDLSLIFETFLQLFHKTPVSILRLRLMR